MDPEGRLACFANDRTTAEEAMGAVLEIRTDVASPARLRALARRERNLRTATGAS